MTSMRSKLYLSIILLLIVNAVTAQVTYLPINTEDHQLLDRLETRTRRLCDSLCLSQQPESRMRAVQFLETVQDDTGAKLSKTDKYNLRQMISENGEWTPDGNGAINSKHPWFHTFYNKQYDLGYVKTKDFFLVVNPVISVLVGGQHNDPNVTYARTNPLFTNSHGVEVRGWIAKKLGFYTSFNDNQESPPAYVGNYVSNKRYEAVPGADYFLIDGNKKKPYYDYLQASGYFDFAAIKNYLNISFGYGKNFFGDGISSLFLSDFSSNMPFLRLNTRIWKLNYTCLYVELTSQYNKVLGDNVLWHKYSTMHYLTYNVGKWLNLGLFESAVFDRPNSYEISYLNPLILTTDLNHFNGNGDKSIVGFEAKVIAAKHLQFYGQFMLNEFRSKEFFSNKGWYGNKWGIQMGGKYFDAFTVKNLDLQGEIDAVRPYTYTAKDTVANYTNYNQPLADPLGSNFIKVMGIARYQPVRNLYLMLKGMVYEQGVDTGSANLGNNIFNPYVTARDQYGVKLVGGPKAHCALVNFNVAYQLRRNLFVDLGGIYRKYTSDVYPASTTTGVMTGPLTTSYVYFGLRLNAPLRDYTFF
jgi:hypothetical protein